MANLFIRLFVGYRILLVHNCSINELLLGDCCAWTGKYIKFLMLVSQCYLSQLQIKFFIIRLTSVGSPFLCRQTGGIFWIFKFLHFCLLALWFCEFILSNRLYSEGYPRYKCFISFTEIPPGYFKKNVFADFWISFARALSFTNTHTTHICECVFK